MTRFTTLGTFLLSLCCNSFFDSCQSGRRCELIQHRSTSTQRASISATEKLEFAFSTSPFFILVRIQPSRLNTRQSTSPRSARATNERNGTASIVQKSTSLSIRVGSSCTEQSRTQSKHSHPSAATAAAAASFIETHHPEKPSARAQESAARAWTVSVAIPGSIVLNAQTQELRGWLVGQVGPFPSKCVYFANRSLCNKWTVAYSRLNGELI